jgi:hypothetical protein
MCRIITDLRSIIDAALASANRATMTSGGVRTATRRRRTGALLDRGRPSAAGDAAS